MKLNNQGEHCPMGPKRIAFDFDGVIHSYKSGWQGIDQIPDEPVEGAITILRALLSMNTVKVFIFSTRNFQEGGIEAMKQYLVKHGLDEHLVEEIEFPLEKKGFHLLIDDRAFGFKGIFPTIEEIINFKAWTEK